MSYLFSVKVLTNAGMRRGEAPRTCLRRHEQEGFDAII